MRSGALLAAKDEEHALAGAVISDGAALMDLDEGNALSSLNVARDVLDKVIRGPLLLVLPLDREGDFATESAGSLRCAGGDGGGGGEGGRGGGDPGGYHR